MLLPRVVVYSPQIIENYQLKSGEGLSVFFVVIWLAGDLANLFGATLAGLLPTIIILAAYVSLPTLLPVSLDVILTWPPVYGLRYHPLGADILLSVVTIASTHQVPSRTRR